MSGVIEIAVELSDRELSEVKRDLAVVLYQRQVLSIGKAAELAGLARIEFQRLLAKRHVPLNYTEADLDADMATLATLHSRTS